MEKLERKIMTVILVIVVILALFLGLIGFISDFMWFKEMGYTAVFFKQLVTQLTVGVPTFIVVAGITTEVLQIRILLNLQSGFFVGITVLSLNDAGAQGQTQRLCRIALTIGEQPGIASLNIRPG